MKGDSTLFCLLYSIAESYGVDRPTWSPEWFAAVGSGSVPEVAVGNTAWVICTFW